MRATTRRQALRSLAATAAAPAFLAGQASDTPPNIVYIICDQMRGDCLSSLGHPNARTPNLDRMAREGVLFTNAFVNNPVCLPSRKTAFSGRYPHEHGSLTNRQKPLLPWNEGVLEHFVDRGYRVGWVGKNHTYEKEHFANIETASIRDREPFRAYNGMVPPHWHTDVYWPEEDCYPQVNSDAAVDFLKKAKPGEPFFLHVSFFDPHPPYMAPSDYTSRYTSASIERPPYLPADRISQRLDNFKQAFGMDRVTPAELTETMRYYYAQIEWGVDKQVGRLLDTLRQQGLAENTWVVFTSDHGDFMGDYGMVRKGMFLYDALLHVPMIWWAPGRLAGGTRTDAMAQHTDLFPTFADLSGGTPPPDLPGRSLKPYLQGQADEAEHATFTSAGYAELHPEQLEPDLAPKDEEAVPRHTQVMRRNMTAEHRTKMLRTQEWKLVLNESQPPELFHMDGGHRESPNVAGKPEHAALLRTMEKRLSAWWEW